MFERIKIETSLVNLKINISENPRTWKTAVAYYRLPKAFKYLVIFLEAGTFLSILWILGTFFECMTNLYACFFTIHVVTIHGDEYRLFLVLKPFYYLHDVLRQQENGTANLSCNADYVCSIQPFVLICILNELTMVTTGNYTFKISYSARMDGFWFIPLKFIVNSKNTICTRNKYFGYMILFFKWYFWLHNLLAAPKE